MTKEQPSLVTIVVRRIIFYSALAMLGQFLAVVIQAWSDDLQLGHMAIEQESFSLAQGLSRVDGGVSYSLPRSLQARYRQEEHDYFARIRNRSGVVLFSNCDRECAERFLPLNIDPPNFWVRQLAPGKPLNVAGGLLVDRGVEPILVEVAILGDKDHIVNSVLAHEIKDHMATPMSLLLLVVLFATTLSITRALKPVAQTAALVPSINPLNKNARLATEELPLEIATLTRAINAACDKVGELMRAQRDFTSAISHEVRTPLAIAHLELEKIADPRARKVESDLETLNQLVEQLTTLARLEGADLISMQPIDLRHMAEDVVSAMAPLVYASGKTIEFVDNGASEFPGHPTLIENALRNLVDNAIRHTGARADIRVEVGPGAVFCVCDNGMNSGLEQPNAVPPSSPRKGLGLKIVNRIAEIHGGRLTVNKLTTGGTRVCLAFRGSGQLSVLPTM
jgi:signal transduction histidine kinase